MTTNKEALDALDDLRSFIKSESEPIYLKEHMQDVETIRQALQRPQIDVEELKKDSSIFDGNQYVPTASCHFDKGWNDCIDHLNEKGYLSQPDTRKDEVIDIDLFAILRGIDKEYQDGWISGDEIIPEVFNKLKDCSGKTIRIIEGGNDGEV